MADISIGVYGSTAIRITINHETVWIPRSQASELLAEFMRAMAESVDAEKSAGLEAQDAQFSRRVPDTPGLRLAGVFECQPDESCGARDGAA